MLFTPPHFGSGRKSEAATDAELYMLVLNNKVHKPSILTLIIHAHEKLNVMALVIDKPCLHRRISRKARYPTALGNNER